MINTTQARERAQAALERGGGKPTKQWMDWLRSMELPSKREGETDEEWTDRIHRSGRELGRFRQCSIGWHDECSDRQGDECECPCHRMGKHDLAIACRELEADRTDIPQLANDLLEALEENERLINVIVALESQIANDDVEVTGRDVTRLIPERGDQE